MAYQETLYQVSRFRLHGKFLALQGPLLSCKLYPHKGQRLVRNR